MAERRSKAPRLCVAHAIGRVRRPAEESEAVALYDPTCPLKATSPYHAFARCPPTALFGKPKHWPGPEGSPTTARILWNDDALYVCWELEGRTTMPTQASQVEPSCLASLQGGKVQPKQRTVLLDERVECFMWQPSHSTDPLCIGQTYFAFEINYDGLALTNRAKFGGTMGFDWDSTDAYSVWVDEISVGWAGSSSPVPSAVAGMAPPLKRVVVAAFRWKGIGIDPQKDVRIGLFRAEYPAEEAKAINRDSILGKTEADRRLSTLVWSSWVDPGDSEVNFHRAALFGKLTLAPAGAGINCSCKAARLYGSRQLRLVASPRPSLEECPVGSILVQAKYASLCGSDLPYFRDAESKAPSCYWDRDGFCGHEVVGVVVESKSNHFSAGDPVMALPSSYFKAHAGSKQEWYREEVHGVLLTEFPVRGGFSQLYTSHELYSYKLKECVPRMLAAQGLGTVLRFARKIGPVLGKHVVVQGAGQNGLIAMRLMAQLCAKSVTAVEPLEYRRALALKFGANIAVTPQEAEAAIMKMTNGRGADVVLEMVGHNQQTINACLEYVACSGIVGAFGVPDDRFYTNFDYTTFFRKNVNMIASVIPDPGVDFRDAVELIEQGRFNTDGIFSHTLPLAEIQKAFSLASNYSDGVVKLVVDLSEA